VTGSRLSAEGRSRTLTNVPPGFRPRRQQPPPLISTVEGLTPL
jgi:hypothetical protein